MLHCTHLQRRTRQYGIYIMTRFFLRPLLLTATAGTALLSACAPVPQLGARPEVRAATSYAADQSLAAKTQATNCPANDWWSAYGDAQLNSLIAEGLADSPDLAAAAARLRSAQGYAQQAGAALLPSGGGQAGPTEGKQSYNNGIPPPFVPKG